MKSKRFLIVRVRRSKLEIHVDILRVLARHRPLKLMHIMYKANVNCGALKRHLEFLIKQKLVEERTVGKKSVVYTITERGLTVLEYFKKLNIALPIIEEAHEIPALLY